MIRSLIHESLALIALIALIVLFAFGATLLTWAAVLGG